MQLSTTHACSIAVAGAADADKLAAAIVAALKKEEVEFHSELEASGTSLFLHCLSQHSRLPILCGFVCCPVTLVFSIL